MSVNEKYLNVFKESHAILQGHFQLTSGLHSDHYMQCALVLQYPDKAEFLCGELAKMLNEFDVDCVVGPALGGIVVAQVVGRALKKRAIFTERVNNQMVLRRGFTIEKGEKILVVEDVTTTGGSVKEVIETIGSLGGDVTGVGALVDRSGGKIDFGVPYKTLLSLKIQNYPESDCPMCRDGLACTKPGSRTVVQ
ncbi:orotate phosphoribosyltransferase [PVC group bacterium]|nr:orotate phosphoribosyltransferase [PVC group bacterium]